jgi:CHU_C Type IX secretion signal domain
VVNDNGSLAPPFDPELQFPINGILECDYGNNVANIAAPQTQLPLDLGPDVAVCANGIWTFDAGAGYAAYRWSNLSEERAITVFLPGKYWVETRDVCGGIYTDTVEITVLPGTGIELGPDTSLCIGATLAMNLPGFETYQWLPGAGLSCTDCANPVASVTADITYAVLVKTAAGCYSSDSIRVKAKPSVSGQLDTMICTGTTLWWNGTEIAAGSSETFYFPAAGASCDSVFTVQVGTLPVFQTSSSMVVCAGDSVLVFGQYQQVAGSYSQLFLSQQGCDSTHSVQLTVLPILQTADTLTICTGDSIQIFGVWRSLPGAYSQLSASQLTGCDSIHITQLEVLPLVSTSSAMQLCAGDSIQLFGSWVSQPGDYAATFLAQNGCDSMHTVTVSVLPALQTVSAQNICLGDSVWQFNQWYTDPGVYTRTFTASGGCDSTHTFTLAVWPPVQAGEQRQICAGDSSYIFGQWQTETGSYSQTSASIVTGCDSTHTVTLLVAPALSAQSNFQICSGDSVQIFGNWQQLPGTYTQVFTAQGGCDSVHTVVLTVAPIWQTSDQWAICSGDSIQIFGQWRKDSGVFSQLFSTAGTGCDSTHTITLTVQPALSSTTELVHCAGDSSLIFGTWQKQAGVYAQVFTAQGGCDSVHTVTLQVLPVAQTTDSRAICTGDSTLVFGQWQKNAGDYNRAFTAANGCDSTHTIVVVALPLPVVEVAALDPGCQSAGSISVSMGQPLWQYSLDGQQFQPDPVFAGLAAGAYTVYVRDLAGCLSKTVVQLDSTATPILVMPADTSVYAGQMIVLSPEVQAIDPQFEWSPTASLSCAQCPAPLALPGENTIYSLLLTDGNGCTVSGETSVTIVPPAVYVPSVFYPEGTAPNNMFSVFASPGVEQVLVLRVYDRWGGLVYEAQGFAADGSLGWNGQWRGKDCAPGVYVYWLEVKMADGSVWKKSGDITLVR